MLKIEQLGKKLFVVRSNRVSKYVYKSVIVEAILVGVTMSEIGYVIHDFIDASTGNAFQGVDSAMVFNDYFEALDFANNTNIVINEAEAKREIFDKEMKSYQKRTIGDAQLENVVKFIADIRSKDNKKS